MKQLSYQTLSEIGYGGYLLKSAPEKVLQIGEGVFLRAFVDCFFDIANEKNAFNGKICVIQPRAGGRGAEINRQDGLYTLYLRGRSDGNTVNEKRVISCISRCIDPYRDYAAFLACAHNPDLRFITSNTTEAGIAYDPSCRFDDAPPVSFPAKLTRFLYERFLTFGNEIGKGFIVLSCELIDNNGKELLKIVRRHAEDWHLGTDFLRWLDRENLFCSSLVDRIVPGYPKDEADRLNGENGYIDTSIDFGEIFGFWVIEGPEWLKDELPFMNCGLPILVTPDITPYKQRKVRILNGAHTAMVLGAYLAGFDIVRDAVNDAVVGAFMDKAIFDEIIPTLSLPKNELTDFAASVKERFSNPFIDHRLLSISLNSVSKWKTRCLPSLKYYLQKFGTLPRCLTFSLAALIAFYRGDNLTEDALPAKRPSGDTYEIHDDRTVLEFFYEHRADDAASLVSAVLEREDFWGEDLSAISGFPAAVTEALIDIETNGAYAAMERRIS